jgi:hypothetical protein
MRVLVACEFSGVVRDAFRAAGHDAMSCDLLPTERDGPHVVGDVLELLQRTQGEWDLMIAHPPCTFLTNAGVRHLHSVPSPNGVLPKVHGRDRWHAMWESARFFRALLMANVPRIAVENPTPHKYAKEIIGDYTQAIQPWQFGHGETKRTCLWLRNLPPLVPTDVVAGRYGRVHLTPPSRDRWKLRSVTYQGIADAMAAQWGVL